MSLLVQALFDGLVNGSVYALLGIGMVLYFRSSRVMNLAHGETYVIAGVGAAMLTQAGWATGLAVAAGIAMAALFSVLMERTLLRSRLHWHPPTLIIITLGVAFTVRGLALLVAGSTPYTFPAAVSGLPFRILGAFVNRQGVLVILVTAVVGVAVTVFFRRTVLGQAMTAAAENPEASQLLGINVGRMRTLSYALAGTLGGLAAWMFVPLSFVAYDRGLTLVLRGFIAAALANMVHPGRALAGGLLLGVTEAMVGTYINPLYRTPIVFGLLLVVMLFLLSRSVRFGGVARA